MYENMCEISSLYSTLGSLHARLQQLLDKAKDFDDLFFGIQEIQDDLIEVFEGEEE